MSSTNAGQARSRQSGRAPSGYAARLFSLVLTVVLSVGFAETSFASPSAPSSPAAKSAATPTEVEAADFASEAYSDAWDYSNAEDQNTDRTDGLNAAVRDGKLVFDATGGTQFSPVASVPGSLAYGRDGAAIPIETARYKRLSFRMTQPSSGVGAILWFTCREHLASCAGGVTFGVEPGDRIYDIALDGASTVGASLPWSGNLVGLQVRPTISLPQNQRIPVAIDWVRLYAPKASSPHGAYPPGSYGSYVIEPQPQPVIDSPVPSEGLDIATAQRGRPWDFTDGANAIGTILSNARLNGYDSRGLNATNAPPYQNDPSLGLGVQPFDATRFHHLSFDLSYEGPFALDAGYGGGKLARLIWTVAGTNSFQESDDIVTYSGVNARPVSVDLSSPPTPLIDPSSRPPQLSWSGRTISALRFDPNEDPGVNLWHLRSIHLRADPSATGATTVRFHDNAWVPGTTADILAGTGAPGTPYTAIATSVAVQSGSNAVTFALGTLPPGSYRVQVRLHHPVGDSRQVFSRTAITMERDARNDPQGALDSVRRSPSGATVQGWARDPDTGESIRVHVYVDGAPRLDVAADSDRPDVARAIPGAQLKTGYRTDVTLATGTHSICTYAINVAAGVNRLLRCASIVVSGSAVGALDGVQPIPGGLRVRGWAIDPDTRESIAVHAYVNSAGRALRADGVRQDIADAYPGYGSTHGYAVDMSLPPGRYTVCTYGIGTAGGDNALLGCRDVTVDVSAPIGRLDGAEREGTDVRLRGWALDGDAAGPITVHTYVNGVGAAITVADSSRADVGAAFPGFGAAHGFDVAVRAAAGSTICVYAINVGGGANSTIGCTSV